MRECEICGTIIQYRHGLAKYCEFCSKIIISMQNSVSELKRQNRIEYYRWYNKYRRIGSMQIGQHRNQDFSHEYQIIHREKLKIFSRGVSYFDKR